MRESFVPDAVFLGIVVALPLAVLATLICVLLTRVKARKDSGVELAGKASTAPAQDATNSAALNQETNKASMLIDVHSHDTAHANLALEAQIKTAEALGNVTALSGLYLELARARATSGDDKGAQVALRSAAGMGAKHGPKSAHAYARLELAGAAYRAGDLTSACEHWQIARTAFQESGQKQDQSRVDTLMRDNGCPTDWVLTDF